MKYLIIFIICFFVGCENVTKDKDYDIIELSSSTVSGIRLGCIEGHSYYYSGRHLASKLNDDGTPVKCGKSK